VGWDSEEVGWDSEEAVEAEGSEETEVVDSAVGLEEEEEAAVLVAKEEVGHSLF